MRFVIFGARGDLAWRKLIPSLYNLFLDKNLEDPFTILLVDRNKVDPNHLLDGVNQFSRTGKADPKQWEEFSKKLQFLAGDFKDKNLYQQIAAVCKEDPSIFYLSVPPSLFGEIPKYLKEAGLNKNGRVVVEKPFGYDYNSAKKLNSEMLSCFEEGQIFRIDHYLGKETVQNILAFRFANPLFEPIWNQKYISYVTITVAETVGVEHRGGYYDHAGALRDMIQNHLMQILCCIAMEPMLSFESDEVRNKKLDVLRAIRPLNIHDAVRGQYGKGWVEGKEVPGYQEEEGVDPHSQTETFAALKLYIDSWRWQGVPFYLRTGKRMSKKLSKITVQFKKVPHEAFPEDAVLDWHNAMISLVIQPHEGIALRFYAKVPGSQIHLKSVEMKFNYREGFKVPSPEAYETLILDVIKNDSTLFMRSDQIETAWKLLTPILEVWQKNPTDFPNYDAGSDGPQSANLLIAHEGNSWPRLKEEL